MIEISVIIPTYNRSDVVARCLEALVNQSFDKDKYEVILSDDGSKDDTRQVTEGYIEAHPAHNIRYIHQPNQGANAARNHALRESRGRLLLIINDDTICTPDMLKLHWESHQQNPGDNVAILGKMAYSPDLPYTLFFKMHLDASFEAWEQQGELDWRAFCTCNVSVKKAFLLEYGLFEESMRYHEDTELAERLTQHGLKLIYNQDALGYHYHYFTEAEMLGVAKREAISLVVWYRKSPHLGEALASLGFPPTSPLKIKLRYLAGDILFHKLFLPLWLKLARRYASENEKIALKIYPKIYQSIKRRTIREEMRKSA